MFDLYLLDADWSLNNANWQWLSCSNFFYQYFRCYSPIAFGKKTDPTGAYIRKWLPKLAGFPDKFIYEPWRAPISVQQQCGCIIGVDYPSPIVEHDIASKENMQKMKFAYDAHDPGNISIKKSSGGSINAGILKSDSTSKDSTSKRKSKDSSSSSDISNYFSKKSK